jgi:hypothetical protein
MRGQLTDMAGARERAQRGEEEDKEGDMEIRDGQLRIFQVYQEENKAST